MFDIEVVLIIIIKLIMCSYLKKMAKIKEIFCNDKHFIDFWKV